MILKLGVTQDAAAAVENVVVKLIMSSFSFHFLFGFHFTLFLFCMDCLGGNELEIGESFFWWRWCGGGIVYTLDIPFAIGIITVIGVHYIGDGDNGGKWEPVM